MGWSDDAAKNRDAWTKSNAEYTDARAATRWARGGDRAGASGTCRESELGVLGDVDGLDVVELGCGTAYFSAWLARRGARPVGVDITPAQLDDGAPDAAARPGSSSRSSRRTRRETGPARRGASTSSLSEYGASIWVDPYRWIPEAARLLRPGGRLVFLRNSTLARPLLPDDEAAP